MVRQNMETKIVIVIEGGLVQEVIANAAVELLTLDHDIEGGAQEYIREIPQGDSPPIRCYVRFEHVTRDAPQVARLWKAASEERNRPV